MTSSYTKDEKGCDNATDFASGRGLGIRHVQVVLVSLASFVAYALRADLSVTVVAMVNESSTTVPDILTYNWDGEIQGYVLSSFFWGYLVTQIPAGVLSEKFGGHRFLYAGLLGSSILTLVLPYCALIGGWKLLCVNRVLQGATQGFIAPSTFTLLGVWSPPGERSRFSSITTGFCLLGVVVAMPLSGYFSSVYGWPSCFYVFGVVGTAVGLLLMVLGADSPSTHRMISKAEKNYIQSSLGGDKGKLRVPWKEVSKSAPYYASMCGYSFRVAVLTTFMTKIPTYLGTVLHFDMAEIGVVSAFPPLTSGLLLFVVSWLCDFIIERKLLPITIARKLFNSVGSFGGAVFLVLLAYAESEVTSVIFLTLAMGIESFAYVGVLPSFVDMSPNFSGAIFSVVNFVAFGLGLWGPNVIGFIVTEPGSAAQWRIVFYLCAVLLTAGNIVYLIWGTSETQWWNWPDRYKSKQEYTENLVKEKKNDQKQSGAC